MFPKEDLPPIRWWVTNHLVSYEESHQIMEHEAQLISTGDKEELVWLLEYPPIYTAGASSNSSDLLSPKRFPVYHIRRGGGYTYHGPGQRIVYVMLNLKKRNQDVRCFVASLEEVIIQTLKKLGINGERRDDRVGIWISHPNQTVKEKYIEEKIASIGIKIRKWVTFHGFSMNIDPDLSHYEGIIPCGINQFGVTSLKKLGRCYSNKHIDSLIRESFETIFGPTQLREYKK
ncbi:Lipoate-protein ligase B [Candidatus Liberibacter americanus str. Sao Paulo]|uniref:Octanoyltransferase n=2 Tax=Candidatus Liberibacter americanus TaxID=309868 RepID=U6B7U0_9HYPH|nr:Lipoate-protein ligase B [Candidatus Liberibacter americanus str. Sao Paulo]EMS36176.1 lipoyltransferase [Candidatus Liberibacter americanus PW_SP]